VEGRRPPHAAERSARLKRERAAAVGRAEHVADLCERLARGADVLPSEISASGIPPARLEAVAGALREAASRWAALTPGQEWTYEWRSVSRRAARSSRGSAPAR
jgi:hypothetical protein